MPEHEPAAEPTPDVTPEPADEATSEPTPEAASEPTPDATPEPAAEPAAEPTLEASSEPAAEPTPDPTLEASSEATPEASSEPAAEPAAEPTRDATPEASSEATPEPAAEPTPDPTLEASSEPAAEPTPDPTLEASSEPAAEPTAEPTPDATPPATGRSRLLHDLRRASRSQLVVAVLLALVGFGAVTQVRTADADSTYAGYREQDLIDVLNGLSENTQRAQSELARLEQRRDELQTTSLRREAAVDEARSQVNTLNILAGRIPVTGPGIRVTIREETDEVDVDNFIDLIQELRSTGAEAIQINQKVRLVAQSSFDKVPGGLLVDGTVLEPPYVVEAIGEPSALAQAIRFLNGPQDELEDDGATVDVAQLNRLDIRAVRDGDGSASGSSDGSAAQ